MDQNPLPSPTALLRAHLAAGLVIAPTIYDALSARLVARSGLPACFMSGFGVAAARYGLPDTGLIASGEMATALRLICAANPGFPVVGDGDNGYGNAMNVRRTVTEYARAGAAAVMIEDQVLPKRCGHLRGKEVVPLAEARTRIRAANDARAESGLDILIVARTDARQVEGFAAALDRCHAFADAGADVLFLEAPESEAELARFCEAVDLPAMVNMVPGGRTPVLTPARLRELGAGLALYNPTLFVAIAAMRDALAALADGRPDGPPAPADLGEIQILTGAEDYIATAARYEAG